MLAPPLGRRGRQGSTDTVTFALSGTTTDNGSATFPSDTQVTLSGYDDTLNFTGSNSTLTLAAQAGEAVPRSERDLMDVGAREAAWTVKRLQARLFGGCETDDYRQPPVMSVTCNGETFHRARLGRE